MLGSCSVWGDYPKTPEEKKPVRMPWAEGNEVGKVNAMPNQVRLEREGKIEGEEPSVTDVS